MSELKQVKASAGSGKTYQLTRRFLQLLERAEDSQKPFVCSGRPYKGYTWPEIMAVTFTNKAAAEMKERVVGGLKKTALCIDDSDMLQCSPHTATQAIDAILRRYHRLNIRTIDSLLALLLRLFSLEFGIRPDFQMVFDEKELFDAIYDHFLSLCEVSESEQETLSATLDTMLHEEERKGFWLQDSIRKRLLDLCRHLRTHSGPLLTDQGIIKELQIIAFENFQKSLQCTIEYFTDLGLPFAKRFSDFLHGCLSYQLFDIPKDSAYLTKESLRDCVNKAGKDKVDARAEAEYVAFKRMYSQYTTEQAALSGAYFMAPAITIAIRLLNGMDELQRQRGAILGSSLAGFVNTLLENNEAVSEAYCRLGCRLHHLLVDEFQDTSREQWQAITPLSQECLAKGGSLFYVGDVKQAIYGWRGGDSALFDEVITQPELSSLALNTEVDNLPDNWRSFKNIVEFNNSFFQNFENIVHATDLAKSCFPEANRDFHLSFATDLTKSFASCSQSLPKQNEESKGYIRLQQVPGGKKHDIEEQTLTALGKLIDELTERRPYGDIAILVRTHDHAAFICDLLVQKDIPVITENSLQLDRHPIVRQLTSFLAFLDFPRDDLAFMTFITGQELFLSEADIDEDELHNWLVKPRKRPLGVCFREDYPNLWTTYVEPFYNQSGLMTPYDLTQETLRVFRSFERYPDAELYMRRFLEVVHLAEENGYASLSAFLEYWQDKSAEEKVPLPENINAVRIMTIHKSKGLEFPVVIIPFHNWNVRPDKDFATWQHHEHHMLTPMKKGLGKIYYTSLGRAVREQLNLLYVAWTRAKEELYGFFNESPTTSPTIKALSQFIELDDNGLFEFGEIQNNSQQNPTVSNQNEIAQLPPLKEQQQLMEWLPRLRVYRHNRDEYFYNERMRGEVAHRAMEHLRITGNNNSDTDRAIRLSIDEFPALGALDQSDLDTLKTDLNKMLHWALSDSDLTKWLTHGEREPEVMDSKGEFKRFDLLYRSEATIVVDFKTGNPSPKNIIQVKDYMNILKTLIPDTTVKGYLVYLDRCEIHPVEEAV